MRGGRLIRALQTLALQQSRARHSWPIVIGGGEGGCPACFPACRKARRAASREFILMRATYNEHPKSSLGRISKYIS
jgi:hypothetical protein